MNHCGTNCHNIYMSEQVINLLAFYLAALDTEAERTKMSEIYETHKHIMLRYALKMTNSREMAEDAVHNVFLSLIKHKGKYFPLGSKELRTKLIIMTKNKCIDILRQHNAFVDDQIDDMDDVLESNEIPVEEQVILNTEYESIKKYVAALNENSRLVLEMKYLLEMTYKEIGEELGMTPKHVDTRIMRAKEKVRKLIAEGGGTIDQ